MSITGKNIAERLPFLLERAAELGVRAYAPDPTPRRSERHAH